MNEHLYYIKGYNNGLISGILIGIVIEFAVFHVIGLM